jgi:hypothetical protein
MALNPRMNRQGREGLAAAWLHQTAAGPAQLRSPSWDPELAENRRGRPCPRALQYGTLRREMGDGFGIVSPTADLLLSKQGLMVWPVADLDPLDE